MPHTPIHFFLEMVKLLSSDERMTYTFQHPVLLSPAAQQQISERLAAMSDEAPKDLRDALMAHLEILKQLRTQLESLQVPYPFGVGALEQLWERELNGEISQEHAIGLAKSEEITSLLSPVYVSALGATGIRLALSTEARKAHRLQVLLVAAVTSLSPSEEAETMQEGAALSGLSIATRLLKEVPDGRIYRSAQQFAEDVIKKPETAERPAVLGPILSLLGSLNLDPYAADRFTEISAGVVDDWMAQMRLELGEAAYFKFQNSGKEDELRMPQPAEALQRAEGYFRRSIALLEGHLKGLTLKALVMTLQWRRNQGEEIDVDELLRLASEAATLIDPSGSPNEVLFIMQIQLAYQQSVDRGVVDRLLSTSVDHYARTFGITTATDLIQQSATILSGIDPARSLELMRDARRLSEEHGTEPSRIFRWNHIRSMIKRAFAPDLPAEIPAGGLVAAAEQLAGRFEAEGWDIRKYCAGLITLVDDSNGWDEKGVALDLLNRAGQLAPFFTEDYKDALQHLSGQIIIGMCRAYAQKEAWPQATRCALGALEVWIELRLEGLTLNQLKSLIVLAPAASEQAEVLNELARIAPLALRIENLCPASTEIIQELYRKTVAAMASQFLKNVDAAELFFTMIQLAKGLRFSTALLRGSRYDKLSDERGKGLLQQIHEAEAELAKQGQVPSTEPSLVDEEIALASYVQPQEFQYSGQTAAERISNLQHEFDANLNLNLLSGIGEQEPPTFSIEQIQGTLDERTVLVNYYLGLNEKHEFALWMFFLTREQRMISWNVTPTPWFTVMVEKGGHSGVMNSTALRIQELRRAIQDTPESDFVAREAGVLLKEDLNNFLGPMLEGLEQLRAEGKDHLCIVPHGPLHYYPFHLIGEPGKPLADSWKVTYLPNMSLLVSPGGKPKVQRLRSQWLSVIGLSFEENSFGLEPIPESIDECRKVAAVFDTAPILEKDATEGAMLNALRSSLYVHLSTHGRHNVVAPSFQSLYMTPDAESDGRLYAHEIVSLDLNGLEVLTLSACETALGRFDVSDNLRGLPASFLLAGVKTIIGTLWPSAVQPSELFFSTFYRELKARNTRLDAFSVAQKETRAQYPEYRDWGPFYLIGQWT